VDDAVAVGGAGGGGAWWWRVVGGGGAWWWWVVAVVVTSKVFSKKRLLNEDFLTQEKQTLIYKKSFQNSMQHYMNLCRCYGHHNTLPVSHK
jgi:hypothetical protein